jgi:ketosteroid isomerase-like protein
MSQENVVIVKAAIDAVNREDWDAAFQDAAPGFELDFSRAIGPYRGVYRLDQARRFAKDFSATFESVRWEADQLIDAGEHVVFLGTIYYLGRDGIETTISAKQVWTIREGAVERFVMYQERQDALEAVGLSEQDAHTDS